MSRENKQKDYEKPKQPNIFREEPAGEMQLPLADSYNKQDRDRENKQ